MEDNNKKFEQAVAVGALKAGEYTGRAVGAAGGACVVLGKALFRGLCSGFKDTSK